MLWDGDHGDVLRPGGTGDGGGGVYGEGQGAQSLPQEPGARGKVLVLLRRLSLFCEHLVAWWGPVLIYKGFCALGSGAHYLEN